MDDCGFFAKDFGIADESCSVWYYYYYLTKEMVILYLILVAKEEKYESNKSAVWDPLKSLSVPRHFN